MLAEAYHLSTVPPAPIITAWAYSAVCFRAAAGDRRREFTTLDAAHRNTRLRSSFCRFWAGTHRRSRTTPSEAGFSQKCPNPQIWKTCQAPAPKSEVTTPHSIPLTTQLTQRKLAVSPPRLGILIIEGKKRKRPLSGLFLLLESPCYPKFRLPISRHPAHQPGDAGPRGSIVTFSATFPRPQP
jgi:hypothetical protein